ncbi:MAG TPA: aldehyde dehydrogenase family protein, partial [Gemmatimonadaceae bacterium]|nr:aldehyde dehydrogenase family protein [Gemmatimonadaceae bacterium]
MTAPTLSHFINGDWRLSPDAGWITDVNPSDARDVVALVPEGTRDDVHAAVDAAAQAAPSWRALSGPAR